MVPKRHTPCRLPRLAAQGEGLSLPASEVACCAATRTLSPVRYAPPQPLSSLVARAEMANVEIAICAMADAFMGTGTSSFTLAITEERTAVFQKPPQSTSEMKGPPPKDEL